jgi:opacity protein-like surface antigen
MGSLRSWIVVGVALAAAPAAAAPPDYGAPGLYVGAGTSFVRNELAEEQVDEILPPGVDVDVDDTWGVRGLLGYRFFSSLAGEVEYEHVGGFDVSAFGTDFARVRADVVTANLKAILPLWRVQPYLLAGVGGARWDFDDEFGLGLPDGDTALVGRLGGGIDFHLTRRLVLDAGADVVLSDASLDVPGAGDIDFLGYFTLGASLQYRFAGP